MKLFGNLINQLINRARFRGAFAPKNLYIMIIFVGVWVGSQQILTSVDVVWVRKAQLQLCQNASYNNKSFKTYQGNVKKSYSFFGPLRFPDFPKILCNFWHILDAYAYFCSKFVNLFCYLSIIAKNDLKNLLRSSHYLCFSSKNWFFHR